MKTISTQARRLAHSTTRSIHRIALFLGASAMACAAGCSAPPQSFATPDEAMDTLVGALRKDNNQEVLRIMGSDARDLMDSGDAVADANRRAMFLRLYDEKHRLTPLDEGVVAVEVGKGDWPLPIPLVKGDKGWSFDAAAGKDEVLSRRIGQNELDAIQTCLAVVDAQREYVAVDHDGDDIAEYAQHFMSNPGKKDGLFWPTAPGEPASPLGELIGQASTEGYGQVGAGTRGNPRPYLGYCFRILTAQGAEAPGGALNYLAGKHMIGGFALGAWPAEYGNSGLMTFMVSHGGTVYQRDLGDETASIAKAMTKFNPGAGWVKCAQWEP